LLLAKRLLTDTAEPVAQVALASADVAITAMIFYSLPRRPRASPCGPRSPTARWRCAPTRRS